MPLPLLPIAITTARIGGSIALRAFRAVDKSAAVSLANRALGRQIASRPGLQRFLGVKPYGGSTSRFYSAEFRRGVGSAIGSGAGINITHAGSLGIYNASQISAIAGGAAAAGRLGLWAGGGALATAAVLRPERVLNVLPNPFGDDPNFRRTGERRSAGYSSGGGSSERRSGGFSSSGGGNVDLGDGGAEAWLNQNFDNLTYSELYDRVNGARVVIMAMQNIIRYCQNMCNNLLT